MTLRSAGEFFVIAGAVILLITATFATLAIDMLLLIALFDAIRKGNGGIGLAFFTGFLWGSFVGNRHFTSLSFLGLMLTSPIAVGVCIGLSFYFAIPPLAIAVGAFYGLGLLLMAYGGLFYLADHFLNKKQPYSNKNSEAWAAIPAPKLTPFKETPALEFEVEKVYVEKPLTFTTLQTHPTPVRHSASPIVSVSQDLKPWLDNISEGGANIGCRMGRA